MDKTYQSRKSFLVSAAYWAALTALFALGIKYIFALLLPFVVAFAAASAVRRPAEALSKRLPYRLCAAVLLTLLIAITVTAAALLGGALIGQLGEFAAGLPGMVQQAAQGVLDALAQAAQRLDGRLGEILSENVERLRRDIPGTLIASAQWLSGPLLDSVGAIGEAAMRLPGFAVGVFASFIASYFIALDYDGTKRLVLGFFPERLHHRLRRIKRYAADTVVRLLRTYAFFMLLTFTELSIGFAAINLAGGGIEYVVPLALITALVDILPVLGVGTVLIPWAVVDLIAGRWVRAVMLVLLQLIIMLVRNFLEPKLIGERFGLSPVLTLAAIYVGGRLFGFAGVFILPLTMIILSRLRETGAFEAE